jgi:thiamine biosynthesis protein ThiI
MRSYVVHYQELALKGRNRPWFVQRLVRNLKDATGDLGVADVRALMGRLEIVMGEGTDARELEERLRRTFGVANFAHAGRTRPDVDELAAHILKALGPRQVSSFRVSARRADKRFPLTSPEIEREVGGRIKQATGWTVSLSEPALTIRVELVTNEAFYFFGKERGPGGLPTGVSGCVVCLLSGGIDSPVAAWRMMRRGCRVHFVHFHSYPIVSQTSQEKVRELAGLLTRWQLRSRLHLVPFGDLQKTVILSVPGPMRVVIYRRFMIRIAERIARRVAAPALVTGEAVGQVASQTLENISVIDEAAAMPILRPLVGMDKDEISAESQRLGTFETSIIPDEDCCTLFTPRHPVTRARRIDVSRAEASLDIDKLVDAAVAGTVVEDFRFPVVQSEVRMHS